MLEKPNNRLKFLGVDRDTIIFLLSLLLAFSIWLIHGLSLKYAQIVTVPVIAESNIDGHAEQSSNSNAILARCRTTGFEIIRLNRAASRKPIIVRFDASDLKYYRDETFFITANELNRYAAAIFGDKTGMETYIIDTLFYRFPFENSKKVPVQPVCRTSFKPQYIGVGPMKIEPDSILVYGEPFHLENINRAYTEPFNLEDLSMSSHGTVHLENIKGVRMSAEKVEYTLDVSRFVEIKAEMPINVHNVPKGHFLIVHPSVASVRFRCAFPVSDNPKERVTFYIDYNDFLKSLGGKCMAITDRLPSGVLGYDIEPQVFTCVESLK